MAGTKKEQNVQQHYCLFCDRSFVRRARDSIVAHVIKPYAYSFASSLADTGS